MPETAFIGPSAAATYLRELLTRPGRYRQLWVRRAEKPREGAISQAAVARVIADYLHINSGSVSEYRRLKDRVNRALRGQNLTPDTLAWFTNAFVLSDDDTRKLWAHFTGANPDEIATTNTLAPPPADAAALRLAEVDTVSLHETYYIGSDGNPVRHSAAHRIQAKVGGVSRVPVRWDTNTMTVAVIRGGTASEIYRCDTGYAFDILLDEELDIAQIADIEYAVTFNYHESTDPYFRRVAPRRIRNLQIEVRFSPDKLPRNIWWGAWQDPSPDSEPTIREPVNLNENECSASKYLSSAERTIIGFVWEW